MSNLVPVIGAGDEVAAGAASAQFPNLVMDDSLDLGRKFYLYSANVGTWISQGVAATPFIPNATTDLFTAVAHHLKTGTPVQVSALVDQPLSQAWQVANAAPTFVDITTAINNATANDAAPFPAGEAAGDYFAAGYTSTFGSFKVVLGTAGTVGTLVWEYWNGIAWTALTGVTDPSNGFTAAAGTYTVTYTAPTDWAARSLNGSASLYYIRARVLTLYTVNPVLTQAFIEGVLPTGLSAATTYWAIYVDANTFQLATSRANALAGTAINITTTGGGVVATTVATSGPGSMYVAAGTQVPIDGYDGPALAVLNDGTAGKASLAPARRE